MIVDATGRDVDPSSDLEICKQIRHDLQLTLFSQRGQKSGRVIEPEIKEIEQREQHFLDVQVVAIYW